MAPRFVALLVAVGLVVAACGGDTKSRAGSTPTAGATSPVDRVADLREQAQGLAAGAPGVLISVRDGSERTLVAIGDASRVPERKLVADDTVMIASVTKALVATAAMSMVQDGSIGLEDSVEKWLPDALPRGRQITVSELLSMSSGLPNYEDSPDFPGPGVLPPEDLVALIADQPLQFAPGSRGQQSNSNYAVLQLILERAAHRRLRELLERRVFKPAGLTHTTLGGTPTALGYDSEEDVTVRDPAFPSAAAGAVASVDDVARFLGRLTAGQLLDREHTDAMERARADVAGEQYGLGLLIRKLPCGTAYGQVGENRGYVIEAWTIPDKARTGVVAATSGAAGPEVERLEADVLCR